METSSTNNSNGKEYEVIFKSLQKSLEIIKNTDKEECDSIQEKVNEAISAWEKARASLLSIDMPNIYELRVPPKAPSEEVLGVICACMYLMGSHTSEHHIKMNKGIPAEVNWEGCRKMLNGWHRLTLSMHVQKSVPSKGRVAGKGLKEDMHRMNLVIEGEEISPKRMKEIKSWLEKPWFNVEELREKSEGAVKFADFVINVVKSAEIIREVRPRIQAGIKKAEMKSQEKED